jgi:hypothetical protein
MPRSAGLPAIVCLSFGLAACGGPAATPASTAQGPTSEPATPPSSIAGASPSSAALATGLPTTAPTALIPTTAPTAAPTAVPAPTAPTSAFSLGGSVWWSGFEMAFIGGSYDAAKHTLTIDATFTNTGTQASELRNLSDGTRVEWNGQSLPGYESSGLIAAGATSTGQISVTVPPDFVASAAILTFGKIDEHRALVPLDGSEATSERPSLLSTAGKVTMGKYVTYTITQAMLVPASCTGYPDRIKYGPLKSDQISVVLFGTAASKDSTNYRWIDKGYVVLPDGTKLASNPAMTLSLPLNAAVPNVMMCFALTIPFEGTYTLKMHEYRSNATGSLVLELQ